MDYRIALHSDTGIIKETNQDSSFVYIAETRQGQILFAVICDGLGGLAKGEVASGTLIRAFSIWFQSELPNLLLMEDPMEEIKCAWDRLLKIQNQKIAEYGKKRRLQLGTTVTAFLCLENGRYLIGHIGDTRLYRITEDTLEILTEDHTIVAKELLLGRITEEEAAKDPRRNVLLQCVGASQRISPDYIVGRVEPEVCYMLCSDGFRHILTKEEMQKAMKPSEIVNEEQMKGTLVELVERNKKRGEKDNITVILVKSVDETISSAADAARSDTKSFPYAIKKCITEIHTEEIIE